MVVLRTYKLGLILACMWISLSAQAGRIDKAYDALQRYDYFEAKRLFEKDTAKRTVPASFGLSILYSRTQSPFYDMDNALEYAERALKGFAGLESKERSKYFEDFGLDSMAIVCQLEFVATLHFERATFHHTVDEYQRFINSFPNSWETPAAIRYRDGLAFEWAQEQGGSQQWKEFLSSYPESELASSAEVNMEKSVFREQTSTQDLESYVRFVAEHPESPYLRRAQDSIYAIETRDGSEMSLASFVNRYTTNPNVESAWRRILDIYLNDYAESSLDRFEATYPTNPIVGYTSMWRDAMRKPVFPYSKEGRWGFLSSDGRWCIPAQYDWVDEVSEGIAIAGRGDSTILVNLLNEQVASGEWEDYGAYHFGHLVVSVSDDEYALLDRGGRELSRSRHEDVVMLGQGIYAFLQNDLWGVKRLDGTIEFEARFDQISTFNDSLLLAEDTSGQGYMISMPDMRMVYKAGVALQRQTDHLLSMDVDTAVVLVALDGTRLGRYDELGPWVEGVAVVRQGDKVGAVNQIGEVIWALQSGRELLDDRLYDGVYQTGKKGRLSFVDTTGRTLLTTKHEMTGHWSDFIPFKKAASWGVMDNSGKTVIEPGFQWVKQMPDGTMLVGQDGRVGLVDEKGMLVIQPEYIQIVSLEEGFWLVRSLDGYQLLDTGMQQILEDNVSNIEHHQGSWVKIQQGNTYRYYDLATRRFLNAG